jgi:folylpolyglutamate synthase/dihydropteroate synthase
MLSFRRFLDQKLSTVAERAPGRTWGLGAMEQAMFACQIPKRLAPHITSLVGSNGKGSCGYLLSKSLQNAEKNVAFISSPHVKDFRERLVINGEMLPEKIWDEYFHQVEDKLDALSYYEAIMLVSFLIVTHQDVDVLILEAGLGGRFDAINVLDSDILLVTSISLEHTEYLGSTEEAIFFEKIQVARFGKSVFANGVSQSWLISAQKKIGFLNQAIDPIEVPSISGVSKDFMVLVANVLVKCFSLTDLSVMPKQIPFRSEVIDVGPILVDTAHNVPAAEYLMHQLVKDFGYLKWDIYCNQKIDRDLVGFLEALSPWVSRGYVCLAEGLHEQQSLPDHLSQWSWVPANVLQGSLPQRPTVIMGSFFLLEYVNRGLAHS